MHFFNNSIKTSLINVLLEERIRLSQSFINNKNDPNLYPNDGNF